MAVIFYRLLTEVLKVNAPKWMFGLKDIYHLGYEITWYGIKTEMKKVKGIMNPGGPATRTEV